MHNSDGAYYMLCPFVAEKQTDRVADLHRTRAVLNTPAIPKTNVQMDDDLAASSCWGGLLHSV